MTNKEIISYVFSEAAKSNVEKRKVGCVIVDSKNRILGKGFNINEPIEGDHRNGTLALHAEDAAIQDSKCNNKASLNWCYPIIVYVSQPPCPDCAQKLINEFGTDVKIEVVKEFMKFDGDKLRYDLVPPSAVKAMAEVLTFGARKYKPNNWKECQEPERYLAALYRHLELWRAGEVNDQDSGMHHLAHAMTNLAFMLELGYNPAEWTKPV